jgi:hypothetical protein
MKPIPFNPRKTPKKTERKIAIHKNLREDLSRLDESFAPERFTLLRIISEMSQKAEIRINIRLTYISFLENVRAWLVVPLFFSF